MIQELEEQQRIATELKQELQSLEMERQTITEKINLIETKLEVQDLQNKVQIKKEVINQLRDKLMRLQDKLNVQEPAVVEELPKEATQEAELQPKRSYF